MTSTLMNKTIPPAAFYIAELRQVSALQLFFSRCYCCCMHVRSVLIFVTATKHHRIHPEGVLWGSTKGEHKQHQRVINDL